MGLDSEDVDKVVDACDDIKKADSSFKFSIVPCKIKDGDGKRKYSKLLIVKSDTHDQAHKRGVWLINNLDVDGLLYWVK